MIEYIIMHYFYQFLVKIGLAQELLGQNPKMGPGPKDVSRNISITIIANT